MCCMQAKEIAEKLRSRLIMFFYLRVISFRMHESDTARAKEFGNLLLMTVGHLLPQRFKQTYKWAPKVTNISHINK